MVSKQKIAIQTSLKHKIYIDLRNGETRFMSSVRNLFLGTKRNWALKMYNAYMRGRSQTLPAKS
jgi:hypothetical protein